MKHFKLPKQLLSDLEADVAARLIGVSGDLALIIDNKGVIRDLALSSDDLRREGAEAWVGKPWIDTVTIESRPKVEELLEDAPKTADPRWRQVNHPSPRGRDVPVRYTTVDIGRQGRIIAVGRDLRAMAAMQQQLLDAQRQMETEYGRLRRSETRYRALFHSTSEAVLIVDYATLKIVETNPRAAQALGRTTRKLAGKPLFDVFDPKAAPQVQNLLGELKSAPHVRDRLIKPAGAPEPVSVSASLLREDTGETLVIVRIASGSAPASATGGVAQSLRHLLEELPDAFVVTDPSGAVQMANGAFLSMAQLATEDQARGQPLDRWLGRASVDADVLLSNLREHGTVRRFHSVIRGEFGVIEDVELSAVSALTAAPPLLGFVIRRQDRHDGSMTATKPRGLTRSVEEMTELVGRVPLKDLVRETTDIIERMCIEAALHLTKDNRASAAEMLGLSRQGLYVKLRRYGIDGPDGDGSDAT